MRSNRRMSSSNINNLNSHHSFANSQNQTNHCKLKIEKLSKDLNCQFVMAKFFFLTFSPSYWILFYHACWWHSISDTKTMCAFIFILICTPKMLGGNEIETFNYWIVENLKLLLKMRICTFSLLKKRCHPSPLNIQLNRLQRDWFECTAGVTNSCIIIIQVN